MQKIEKKVTASAPSYAGSHSLSSPLAKQGVRSPYPYTTSPCVAIPTFYVFFEEAGSCEARSHFSLPLILGTLDITIDDNTSAITNIFYAILVLTIIAMLCFINVLGYFSVYLLTNKYSEEKYPKFKKNY